MLPKPLGGRRLIAARASCYRAWQRAKRVRLEGLRRFLDRKFRGVSTGRSAIDYVRALAARAETAAPAKMHPIALVADCSKDYEAIDLDGLQFKFDQMKAPPGFAKLSFNAWRGPRSIWSRRHRGVLVLQCAACQPATESQMRL